MPRTAVRLVSAAAIAAALMLTACSPVMTDQNYSPSDGVAVRWSENAHVKGTNLLLLADGEGSDARLVGGLSNDTDSDIEVTLGFVDGAVDVVGIPAHSTYLLDGSPGRDVVLPGVPVPPGATATMAFSTPELGSVTLEVPVLDGTLAEYADLVP